MGCGKSVVGPHVARSLCRPFLDNDLEVERAAGARIAELFATRGEAHFRELEREATLRAAETNAVVALGGGAIVQPGRAEWLAEHGTVVYLSACEDVLMRRLSNLSRRPLLANLTADERAKRVRTMLAERQDAYRSAAIVVDTDEEGIEGVASEIVQRLLERWASE